MKKILSLLGLIVSASSAMSNGSNPDQTDDTLSSTSFKVSDACAVLSDKNCRGNRKQIQFTILSGYFLSSESINDDARTHPLNGYFDFENGSSVSSTGLWRKEIKGQIFRFGKIFKPTENFAIRLEAYGGKISGSMNISAKANTNNNIENFNLSSDQFHQISSFLKASLGFSGEIPEEAFSPALNNFKGMSGKKSYHYNHDLAGRSYYGGFRQSAGISLSFNSQVHLIISQFAQAGLDRMSYGAGLGLAYSSTMDDRIGARSSNICQEGEFKSSARYAFGVAVCTEKMVRDPVYNRTSKKAAKLVQHIQGSVAEEVRQSGRTSNNEVSYEDIPQLTSDNILNAVGIRNPYNGIRASLVIAASMNFSGTTLALSYARPVGSARYNLNSGTTSLILGRNF